MHYLATYICPPPTLSLSLSVVAACICYHELVCLWGAFAICILSVVEHLCLYNIWRPFLFRTQFLPHPSDGIHRPRLHFRILHPPLPINLCPQMPPIQYWKDCVGICFFAKRPCLPVTSQRISRCSRCRVCFSRRRKSFCRIVDIWFG